MGDRVKGIAMHRRHIIFAALLLAGGMAQAQEAPKKIFHGVGDVTGIDADAGLLQLNHEAIPGLMDAMEMQFDVKPASLLQGLKKGDRVAFDIDGASLAILSVHKRK
jgi:Cu/Ag efflux protein CusF